MGRRRERSCKWRRNLNEIPESSQSSQGQIFIFDLRDYTQLQILTVAEARIITATSNCYGSVTTISQSLIKYHRHCSTTTPPVKTAAALLRDINCRGSNSDCAIENM